MKSERKDELIKLISKHIFQDGEVRTSIPGVSLFKATDTNQALPNVYSPCLCFIVQGHKQVILNNEVYEYGVSQFLAVTIDLPIISIIKEATKEKPYLLIKIDIQRHQLFELLINISPINTLKTKTQRGLFIGDTTTTITDCLYRLACAIDNPSEALVLGQQIIREILYRVLQTNYGHQIAQMSQSGSNMEMIGRAVNKLRLAPRENFIVKDLAEAVGMSVSTFHMHFKLVTAMTPLQFQKTLRLIEARQIMLSEDTDATTTAYLVGYESISQFSREYARMFGAPPIRDIVKLKKRIHL